MHGPDNQNQMEEGKMYRLPAKELRLIRLQSHYDSTVSLSCSHIKQFLTITQLELAFGNEKSDFLLAEPYSTAGFTVNATAGLSAESEVFLLRAQSQPQLITAKYHQANRKLQNTLLPLDSTLYQL